MDRELTKEIIRNYFNNILNSKPTEKELTRQKEIDEIARQEKEEYEKKNAEFYANPLHWSNNKRRRHNLPVLRGKLNKCRAKRYPSFRPTARFFCLLEDVMDRVLTDKFKSNEFFGKFVDLKDLNMGNSKEYYVGGYEEKCKGALDEYFRETKYSAIRTNN